MAESDLVVSTTTDSAAVATAVATGDDAGARVPGPGKFDGATAAYEHPRSERRLLLERLAEHERDLEELTNPEDEAAQVLTTNDAQEGEPEAEPLPADDMDAIREQARQDALEVARRRNGYYQAQHDQHFSPQQAELIQMRQGLEIQLKTKLASIVQNDESYAQHYSEMMSAQQAGTEKEIAPKTTDALLALQGGAEAVAFLVRNPGERQRITALPEELQLAEIGRLTAKLTTGKRAVSLAPKPISPVGGSSTKSSLPMDQLNYQDYRRRRDAEAKTRYRR